VGFYTYRLNACAGELTPVEIAKQEAEEIDKLAAVRPLRLHVVGDCRTNSAAKIVSAAAERYVMRSHSESTVAWTYTHAWREVERSSWREVSVLASCETVDDCFTAMDRGYATALVVPSYADTKAYKLHSSDGKRELTVIPCPHSTKGVQCVDCKLCFNDQRLLEEKLVIGFTPERGTERIVRHSLAVLNGS
jgi:hypothetical protein